MSEPNSADFALLKIKTADGPPAVLTQLCGIMNVTINRSVNVGERYRRDCAKPNRPGVRKIRNNGESWNINGSGEDNVDLETQYSSAFGVKKEYVVELYKDDGTDGGDLMGSYAGTAMMTSRNQSFAIDGDEAGTADITLEGEGTLTWTAAA